MEGNDIMRHHSSQHMSCLIASIVLMIGWATPAASAKDDDWKRLGTKEVQHRAERDEIDVGADEGVFKALKFEVKAADLEIIKITVVYVSGDDEELNVREKVKKDGETRAIDLKGGKRAIKKVVLFYRTEKREDRDARVILYGRR